MNQTGKIKKAMRLDIHIQTAHSDTLQHNAGQHTYLIHMAEWPLAEAGVESMPCGSQDGLTKQESHWCTRLVALMKLPLGDTGPLESPQARDSRSSID
ncbi:hypothetical protein RRG08_063967 [Elysia crispata]|uniref:Uncharacterized protein n=1 Tax=Elysia crispata TaxID=231223 RepID=A0AAE0YEE9_9GAST|nr:hypothetical protein RRG08_063967 [Elysia crispata]